MCADVDSLRQAVSHLLLVWLQPNTAVKSSIRFRLVVFSSLFLSLNTDLGRDDDQQGDQLKVFPPSAVAAASGDSPQPVSQWLVECNCLCGC